MKKSIYKNNVLVTGASSGIGKEIALLFCQNGFRVYAVSRNIEEKRERSGKGEIIQIRADVTDTASLEKLREKIEDLSIIVHAAGFGIAGSAEDMDIDLARREMDVNYFGPMAINRIFLPLLRKNEHSLIIFISSIAGRVPIPFQSHYSASKYALEAYAEALRMEAGFLGVNVTLLEPGDTKTGFTSKRMKCIPSSSIYREKAEKAISRMEKDEEKGRDPLSVAKAALKVAKMKNPPVRKPIGVEYSLLMFLLRLLPERAVHMILKALY